MSESWRTSLLFALVLVAVKLMRRSKRHPPFPPGPPKDPLIGNLRSMPLKDEDMYFYGLGKEYGDIVHMEILGRHLVVVNSVQAASDLLEKKSLIYSGRPRVPLVEILGLDNSFVFSDYGTERFQLHRRVVQKFLAKENVIAPSYRSCWIKEARSMIQRLISAPEIWDDHLQRYATAIVLEIACGHRIASDDDPYLKLTSDVCQYSVPAMKPPEGSLVDLFPILKYLPAWIPGNYWVGRARFGRQFLQRFEDYPIGATIKKMAEGSARPSFLVNQLEDIQAAAADPAMNMDHLKAMFTTFYLAGVETTSSTLSTVVAALLLYPDCQQKAQDEIERCVGSGRLPDFSDRPSLPYVEALINEASRWHPTLALGVPHAAMSDDVYQDMFVPKGSVILANVKAMGLDEKVYRDPELFNPSRYLPIPDGWGEPPLPSAFGFGRRICPGRFLADDTVWIAIVTMLATVSILKPFDEAGKEYMPDIVFKTGLTNPPQRFPLRLQPRNDHVQRLMTDVFLE